VSALKEAKEAWASNITGLSDEDIGERARGLAVLVRAIARDGILRADRFAQIMKFDLETAKEMFAALAAIGAETDESDNIVGAYVTGSETPFKLRVIAKDLYAWSALHALFIPGILGAAATIDSLCPVSGRALRIRVSGRSVRSLTPSDVWLSVFLPSRGPSRLGPDSQACRQMNFFGDRETAEEWVKERSAVIALSLEDAFELALAHWVDRIKRAKS